MGLPAARPRVLTLPRLEDIGNHLRKAAGTPARGLDRRLHRRLHPWRRRRAVRLLRSLDLPAHVVFICYGNICRSPYAAAVFRGRLPPVLGERIRVSSAGFSQSGRESPEEALASAGKRGQDLSGHRSTMLDAELVASADLLVVMDAEQRDRLRHGYLAGLPAEEPGSGAPRVLVIGDLDPDLPTRRGIVDPFGQPRVVFDGVYRRIDRCVESLVTVLEEQA